MHLVFFLRGVNSQVELWKVLAQSQFFIWTRTDKKTGKDFDNLVQGALRPSVLGSWEYVFPEECLPAVLSMFGLCEGSIGATKSFMNNVRLRVLRKILGVKKIPKKAMEEGKLIAPTILINGSYRGISPVYIVGVALHPIGIKKDIRGEMLDPSTGKVNYQEML